MVRLIVSDIDGTLVGRDEKIPADAPAVLDEVRSRGVLFTLATGRSDCLARHFADSFGCDIPYTTCNGAAIVDRKGRVFQRLRFPIRYARGVIGMAMEAGIAVICTVDGDEFVLDTDAEYVRQHREIYSWERTLSEDEWQMLEVDKISFMSSFDDAAIALLEAECRRTPECFSYTRYQDRSVELVAPGVSKASGVEQLAAMLSVPMSEVMFIGDHQNDIPLMKVSGVSAAVGNATEDAKRAAGYVCSRPLFEGVAEAIDRFVLRNL